MAYLVPQQLVELLWSVPFPSGPAARRRRGLRAAAAGQFVARPSDLSRRRSNRPCSGQEGAVGSRGSPREKRRRWREHEREDTAGTGANSSGRFRRASWRYRSAPALAKQTRDGTAPSYAGPEPNTRLVHGPGGKHQLPKRPNPPCAGRKTRDQLQRDRVDETRAKRSEADT